MMDYFPVMIKVEGDTKDIIFIDRKGEKFEPEIVNAVLNSIEIDTSTHGNNNDSGKRDDSNTIDI